MAQQLDLHFKDEALPRNILPYDGEAIYYGKIFDQKAADAYFKLLLADVPWKNDEVSIYGKHYVTDRKIAWFGNEDYSYKYSNKTRIALPWTSELLEIKKAVEEISGVEYNSCLLNLYENGGQGMGWHRDGEKELQKGANIASVTFGAERRFDFRHDESKEKASIVLEHGALLIMRGVTQSHWMHHIPKSAKVAEPRINLTFRKMLENPKML